MLKELFSKNYKEQKSNPFPLKSKSKKSIFITPVLSKRINEKTKIDYIKEKSNFTNYQNLGLNLLFSNKNIKRHKRNINYNTFFKSNDFTKSQNNSSNIYLTTNTSFNIDNQKNKKRASNSEGKFTLIKKKINLQNEILKLKNEKYNLLKQQNETIKNENKITLLNKDLDKIKLIIDNYKNDYNLLNLQYTNLKNKINLMKQNKI